MDEEERASLEKLLDQRQRNLYKLQEKAAVYAAGEVPLHLQNQIEAEEKVIADIKTKLAGLPVGEERKTAERRKRPPREPPSDVEVTAIVRIKNWWASLASRDQVKVIVALITLFGVVFGVLFTPVAGKLADICLPIPRPIPVTALPTPTATVTITSTPMPTPTSTSSPTPTFTPSCPICINEAIRYENGGASLETVREADPTRPDAIRITFANPFPDSFSAWVVPLHTCDASASESLSFWVRGENGGEKFEVGIKDSTTLSGQEPKVQQTASAVWQHVSIPLQKFQDLKKQDLSSLEKFSLGFKYDLGSGTIYIDKFTLGPP